MILITGATGPFGFHVITSLLQLGTDATEISALVRDKKKASLVLPPEIELKQGNYDDFESLKNAFRGADKLMFVSGNEIGKRDSQHKNVVDAAKDAGVKHIIYTSFIRKEISQPSKVKTGGSTFKNPIDQSNLKVWEIIKNSVPLDIQFGDAAISQKHCNFFVNKRNANCVDMKKLIDFVKDSVMKKTGIKLELEIILVE